MATQVPSTAGFITVDTSSSKTLQLPLSTQRIGRIITIKDRTGQAQTNPIIIQTQGGDTFQDAATTYRITVPFGSATFISRSGQWILQQGTQDVVVSTIKGDGSGLTNLPLAQPFQSTVAGLGTASYISSLSLVSTVRGLGSASYVSTASLISTTGGLQTFVLSSIQNQPYSYAGTTLYMNYSVDVSPYKALGNDFVFISSQRLVTTIPANTSNVFLTAFQTNFSLPSFIPKGFWDFIVWSEASATNVAMYPEVYLRSTTSVEYLVATGVTQPISAPPILTEWQQTLAISTVNITGGNTIVVKLFANNTDNQSHTLSNYFQDSTYSHVHTTFGTIFPDSVLQSTVAGLGQAGYVSTATLFSTSAGLFNYINTFTDVPELTSTVAGLGSATYISTASLVSTTAGLQFQFQTAGFLSTANLTSTVAGLGSAGYASTSFVGNAISTFSTAIGASALPPTAFTSTVAGLGSAGYVSTATLFSTTTGLYNYVSTFIDPVELTSTIVGLGSANFVSTIGLQARLQSTVEGLGSASYISSLSLTSTVAGLGSSRYISTQISSFLTLSTGNITTSTLTYLDAANNAPNLTYVSSGYFFYNSSIVSGAFQLQPQFINF